MMINKRDFLERAQLDHDTLEVWIEEEWLVPQGMPPELAFFEADLARVQLIQDLMQDLGVNAEGVGVILNLLDQVHGLRRVLAEVLRTARERSSRPDATSSPNLECDRD